MTWIITADRPIYLQLVEQLELAIVAGLCRSWRHVASSTRSGQLGVPLRRMKQ